MTRVNLIVEGQTEERFVRELLLQPLAERNVFISVRAVETSRDKRSGKVFRGGLLDYARAKKDIQRWLAQDTEAYVSTMFDLFRLPNDFPSYAKAKGTADPYEKAQILMESFGSDIGHSKFLPYIQLHEFEALLFSAPEAICKQLSLPRVEELQIHQIYEQFETPEHINDSDNTAPSKRLLVIYPDYEKITHGVNIASAIGLETMRQKCRHFNQWLEKLENLAQL